MEFCAVGFSMEAEFDWMGHTTVGTATAEEDYLEEPVSKSTHLWHPLAMAMNGMP